MTASIRSLATALAVCFGLLLAGCGDDDSNAGGEHDGGETSGEHDGGEGEHGEESEAGEESGTQFAKAESYDETRGGARLLLRYDGDQDAFVGTVTNTTDALLDQVRIEVHLSNGIELGPTTPSDLQPGGSADVTLHRAVDLPGFGRADEPDISPEDGRDPLVRM